VALLALRFDAAERASGRRLLGLLVGFSGVVALVGVDVAGSSSELLGAAAVAVAACGYAAAPMILKRKRADLDPRATTGASFAIAAVALAPIALIDPPTRASLTGEAEAAIVVLGLFCTAVAFVLMATLVTEVGPGRALVIAYVNPVVAVALGVAVLGERLGAGAIAGLLLILAGSWLSTDGRLPPGLVGLATRYRRGRRSPRRSLRRA
jgi:drug/metabolite transporter (DMT)-like permease